MRALPGSSRVYEIAAASGTKTAAVLAYLAGVGVRITDPGAAVPPILADLVAERLGGEDMARKISPSLN